MKRMLQKSFGVALRARPALRYLCYKQKMRHGEAPWPERFLQDQSWQMQVSCPSSSSLRYVFHLFVLFDPIIPLPHLQAGVVSKGPFFLPLTSWEQRSRRAPQRAGRTK